MPHPNGPCWAGTSSKQAPQKPEGATPSSSLPPPSCLTGYINYTLPVFYTKDFQDPVEKEGSENVTECRFGPPSPGSAL